MKLLMILFFSLLLSTGCELSSTSSYPNYEKKLEQKKEIPTKEFSKDQQDRKPILDFAPTKKVK